MRLTAVFETWHIGDGNYPPLHKGQLVKLSFEMEPHFLRKSAAPKRAAFEQVKDAGYRFAGTVMRVYSDPPSGRIVVIEAGDFRFFVSSFPKEAPSLSEADQVEGEGRLVLDHYIWVEFLSSYDHPPDLFYQLRVVRIRLMKIPNSFISRAEKGTAGPASLNEQEYPSASAVEVEIMEKLERDWVFFLVDFDSSDVGLASIPPTFRA